MGDDLGRQVAAGAAAPRLGPAGLPAGPVVEARPRHPEQPGHPGDLEPINVVGGGLLRSISR